MLGSPSTWCGLPLENSCVFHARCARSRSVRVCHHERPPTLTTTRSSTRPSSFATYEGVAGMFRNRCIMYSCCERARPLGRPTEKGAAWLWCTRTCPSGAVADSTS